jgi:hypothetical protein
MTGWILEAQEQKQFVGFCFVIVSTIRLPPSSLLSLTSCHHASMSRRL